MVPNTGKRNRIISQAKVEPMFFCLYNTRSIQTSAAQVWAKMKSSVQVMSFKKVIFGSRSGCVFKFEGVS